MRDPLANISPLDGRYAKKIEELSAYFSESALMKYRVMVEIEWFIFLFQEAKLEGTKEWSTAQVKQLRTIYETFDMVSAERVKSIENTTNHDVKAIEYFIKENFKDTAFEPFGEFVHFACTSEDINNLSYALMLRDARDKVLLPLLTGVAEILYEQAIKYKSMVMMARTHGQPASPTTLGKELINFLVRFERQIEAFSQMSILGKINGATGNYNAHLIAYNEQNWQELSKKFIQSLELTPNLYTTQIEPHDFIAEYCDVLRRINTILIDFNRDTWTYISLGYFKQKVKEGEVGSSTMPHKVNPIDFENSEGNLGIANALLQHFSEKLPISRLQRDLTDSTVLRNLGCALGYCLLAYKNCIQGIKKLEINESQISADIEESWELLAEPIQTILRKYKIEGAYEKLKALTRGKKMNKKSIQNFINDLDLPAAEKKALKSLTPSKYSGLASKLVEDYKPLFLNI